jgi:hypothetical protein
VASGVPGTDAPGRRFSPFALAAAFAVPAIPIVIGLLIGASGSEARQAAKRAAGREPAALTFTARTLAQHIPELSPVPPGFGALVARIVHPTTIDASPGGRAIARIGLRSDFGSPSVVLVQRHQGHWLGVISTQSGNNHLGWIRVEATALTRVPWEIKVSLSARRLEVINGGKVLARYTVAVGRPTAPTPTGRFEVTDRLATGDPAGPYGCCVIALSAKAPHAIEGWGGGNRIAIHSTPETWSIGQPVSHGCLRMTFADARWLMTHVPLGTPTVISS